MLCVDFLGTAFDAHLSLCSFAQHIFSISTIAMWISRASVFIAAACCVDAMRLVCKMSILFQCERELTIGELHKAEHVFSFEEHL